MSIPKNSKQDWDTITGWEKRIKVDFGSIGPNHVRWSHWTYKERDIVARKIHEITDINDIHGNRSKIADDWRKENAPIMVDFARDGKPMPDWAHAEYRESGVPEHVQVIWKRVGNNDITSKGDWAYDPVGPWEKGEEPAWSSKPTDPEYTGYMDKKYGGVMSYTENKETGDRFDTNGNLISTRESRAKEDVPNWRKHELGRLEDVDGHIVPGPNALPKDIEQYGHNVAKTGRAKKVKPVKIMPGDTAYTPLEKALNWAAEEHHGLAHQNRWNHVAATMGAHNGYDHYDFYQVKKLWLQFGKNARWTVAINWFDSGDEDVQAMVNYHFAPAMQGNYSASDFETLWNQKPVIVQVKGWGKAIIDPKVGIPTYWLDGEGEAVETWERVGDDWQKVDGKLPVPVSAINVHGEIDSVDCPTKLENTVIKADPVIDTRTLNERLKEGKQILRTATLREVYDKQKVGGWRESTLLVDPPVWVVSTDEGYIQYPEVMQPDMNAPTPKGLLCWTPSEWLAVKMELAGFKDNFEGFLHWHETGYTKLSTIKPDMQEVIVEEAAVGLANESDPKTIKQMLKDLIKELFG